VVQYKGRTLASNALGSEGTAIRPLEILTAALTLLCLLRLLATARSGPLWLDFLPVAALAVALLQLVVEGYRWQMLPLEVLALTAFVAAAWSLLRRQQAAAFFGAAPARRRISVIARAAAAVLLSLLAVLPPALFPVPTVPAPTDPYSVGTFDMALTDTSRREIYSAQPDDPRRIMIQVWYPAAPLPGDALAPWLSHTDIVAPAIAGYLHLPSFFLDHLKYARSQSYLNAPPAAPNDGAPPFPVLLFSHGWNGFRSQNTYQVQELASHGYVVVALEHTYGARVTVFPDGQIAFNNPQALAPGQPENIADGAAQKLVDQWAGDLGFVLDTLAALNMNDLTHGLAGRLDLNRVGVFGHSTGGGAAIRFCSQDARCKAGLGEDAWMTPVAQDTLDRGVPQSFLFMFSQKFPTAKNWRLFAQLYGHSTGPDYLMTIQGTAHYDFTDLPMLTPLAAQLGLKGPLSGPRVLRIIDDYLLAFFDQYLKGQPATVLRPQLLAYPEVQFSPRS
jgi:predicted dienelactone hydrolase